jgi:hypothetical protein
MYVKSSLAASEASSSEGQPLEPSSIVDAMTWPHEPSHKQESVDGFYGFSGVMRASKLATSPSHVHVYPGGCYTQSEHGSDASTVDTSPYVADEAFAMAGRSVDLPEMYTDMTSNMAWNGGYPPMESQFLWHAEAHQQEAEQVGWMDFGQTPHVPQLDLISVGSQEHHIGQCKPCAFFHTEWKTGGCQSGKSCNFCHLCPPGEKQRRKRVMRQLQRNAGL